MTSQPHFSPRQEYFHSSISSFIDMVKSHLAGVRELKENGGVTNYRYSFSRSRGSSTNSRPASRDYAYDDFEMDRIRWNRKSMSFRPRFDPTSVRRLCNEALAEL